MAGDSTRLVVCRARGENSVIAESSEAFYASRQVNAKPVLVKSALAVIGERETCISAVVPHTLGLQDLFYIVQ